MGKEEPLSIQVCGIWGEKRPVPRFLNGSMAEVVANPQRSNCAACPEKEDPAEPRWVGNNQSPREQRTIRCVAEEGPEVS